MSLVLQQGLARELCKNPESENPEIEHHMYTQKFDNTTTLLQSLLNYFTYKINKYDIINDAFTYGHK